MANRDDSLFSRFLLLFHILFQPPSKELSLLLQFSASCVDGAMDGGGERRDAQKKKPRGREEEQLRKNQVEEENESLSSGPSRRRWQRRQRQPRERTAGGVVSRTG
jgi:hypothetical protein